MRMIAAEFAEGGRYFRVREMVDREWVVEQFTLVDGKMPGKWVRVADANSFDAAHDFVKKQSTSPEVTTH